MASAKVHVAQIHSGARNLGESDPESIFAIAASDVSDIVAFLRCGWKDWFEALVHVVSASWAWA